MTQGKSLVVCSVGLLTTYIYGFSMQQLDYIA